MKIGKFTITRRDVSDYMLLLVGAMFYTVGWGAFMLPYQITIGGVAGVSSIVYFVANIPADYVYFVINAVLMLSGLKVLGFKFMLKTIFTIVSVTLMLRLVQTLLMQDDGTLLQLMGPSESFMACILGSVLTGLGLGFIFMHNGSTGGTDIVAAMVSKYRQVSVGRMILYVDLIIISSSFIIYHDLNKVIYGYVVLVFLSYMADQVVNNTRQAVQFTIFSKRWDEIATAVNHELHRGCTIVDGTGWYTRQEVKMLIIFCRKSEALDIYRLIKELDPHAFMSQSNVNTVYGEGFDENKVKARRRIDKQRKLQEAKENEARG